ncbi:MAG: 1-(5-phosphoribosyl)-5-[Synergistaceae bacterium]|nr:1-(5-phosphoribosyl)-5-[(5-phosphoribosylamino)methylideneamino]imidazole-4-carboxamide isomerase [Synergistaceae bacterium]
MKILPAIDLFEAKAVRLLKGDYNAMTVYDPEPVNTALKFRDSGAEWLHIVDLEGAKTGQPVNLASIMRIREASHLKCEVGGGIRDIDTIKKYIDSGVERVILGTAAVSSENLVSESVKRFGDKIAVGVDIRDGKVSIKGWQEDSGLEAFEFCRTLQDLGVRFVICTDISRDGAMKGTNRDLYRELSQKFDFNIIASGGVSSLDDVKALAELKIYGAIIGKAYYTGAINIREAIEAAKS